jgi:flagellar secretion chaperone FliS
MSLAQASTARYVQNTVTTASPGRLLVMLYDRLALDLARAGEALEAGDRTRAHPQLLHAQDIVTELHNSLDHSVGWDGSKSLAALYSWLSSELVNVNMFGDLTRLRGCQQVVEPLRESWHAALEQTAAQGAPMTSGLSGDARLVG